jgi:hypothetical protein
MLRVTRRSYSFFTSITFTLCSLLVLSVFLTPTTLHAQSVGVQILPAAIEEAADPGGNITTDITVRNVSQGEQTLYLIKKDIAGVRDDATPIFAEEGMEPTGYELTSWVTVSEEPIVLAPGSSAKVPVTITVPESATPGSHFGGVFVSAEPPRLRANGASVGYEVGSIISIRIRGDVVEDARIRSFSTTRAVYTKPEVQFSTRVENPGNVLIRPRGPLEVFNMFGKRVSLMTVNDAKGGVFPGTTRAYETIWKSEDLAIGRYQGIVSLVYGEEGTETTVSATVSFWVLPLKIIVPILGILMFIVLSVYFGVRLHIKRTLDRYQGRDRSRVVYSRRARGVNRLTAIAIGLLIGIAVFLVMMLALFA